ncbi:hypothetical protein DK419_26810 [Methylobacterium terrae]|uniref:DUF3761 domain-containing protein n=1 Tax=Methylobacterium terrae TaxID=2202827 RepID=A0A2U8WTV9_9HYPH|nr:DUF3761 domain-containing protein [Methylobacterium terrae]AWN49503.1 hypothetical protein DK419_26810 [Methylobacterium terrae]
MRWRSLGALLTAGALVVGFATGPQAREYQKPRERELTTHRHYVNVDGRTVHSPAKTRDGRRPTGASAKCRDGSWSFSRHRRGTCSGHHGVAAWLR